MPHLNTLSPCNTPRNGQEKTTDTTGWEESSNTTLESDHLKGGEVTNGPGGVPRRARSRKSKRLVDDSKTAIFEKPVLTATFFIERGSRLVMDQIRAPNAYRETTSFCRTDIGEFTNMSKGRAVREFEFMYNLEKDGKNRISERLLLQSKLRHHCGKDYQHANMKKIEALLEKARPLGGSVLQLEVNLAEKFLVRLRQWLHRLVICQKIARGYVTRQILRRQQSAEAARLEALRQRARASKAFAKDFVADLLTNCMRRHAGETRATRTTTLNAFVHSFTRPYNYFVNTSSQCILSTRPLNPYQ